MQNLIIKTPVFRLVYARLHTPYRPSFVSSDVKARYMATMLFDKETQPGRAWLLKHAFAMVEERFGEDTIPLIGSFIRMPLKDGEYKSDAYDFTPYYMVNAKSLNQPILRDATQELEHEAVYTADARSLYNGCLCTAEITLFTYDAHGHRGVGASLLSVTKIAEAPITPEEANFLSLPDGVIPEAIQ